MNKDLTCLVYPENGKRLIPGGGSVNTECGHGYPIIRGIPRFVGAENYSKDFGIQWNMFPKTQLDSWTGLIIQKQGWQGAYGEISRA